MTARYRCIQGGWYTVWLLQRHEEVLGGCLGLLVSTPTSRGLARLVLVFDSWTMIRRGSGAAAAATVGNIHLLFIPDPCPSFLHVPFRAFDEKDVRCDNNAISSHLQPGRPIDYQAYQAIARNAFGCAGRQPRPWQWPRIAPISIAPLGYDGARQYSLDSIHGSRRSYLCACKHRLCTASSAFPFSHVSYGWTSSSISIIFFHLSHCFCRDRVSSSLLSTPLLVAIELASWRLATSCDILRRSGL